jgi:thymidylate kinase
MDAMDVDEQRTAISQANRESRLTADQIQNLEDIARHYREAARKSRQYERIQGGEKEAEVEANLWRLVVEVSIDTQASIYYN